MGRREQEVGAMNRVRMRAILEAYGAAPARWPETERAAAQAWADANDAAFAEMARAETALDGLLALDHRDGGDETALTARILASHFRGGDTVVRPTFGRTTRTNMLWREATALAACAMLGIAIGFASAPSRDDSAAEMDTAFGAAFQMPGADFADGAGG